MFSCTPVHAGATEAFESAVSNGIKAFFVNIADTLFNVGGTSNVTEAVKNDKGYVIGSVFKVATYKNDPYNNKTVQDMREKTSLIGIFLFVIIVFFGGARTALSCGNVNILDRIEQSFKKSPLSAYKDNLIIGFVAIFFVHYGFKFLIMLNDALTVQSMYGSLDLISFNLDNWVMYFAMSVCYAVELSFFVMRILVQDLLSGSDILIGSLFALETTREAGFTIVKYFAKVTFLQFIIVLLTSFGIAIIESSDFAKPLGYIVLTICLAVISAGLMFGFTAVFKTSKTAIKGVVI
jgi:hypothetical protein